MDNLPTWEAQIEFARGHDDQDTLGKFNLLAGSRDCPITLIRPLTLSKMSSFNENDPPIFKADKLEQVVAGFGELKILAGKSCR